MKVKDDIKDITKDFLKFLNVADDTIKERGKMYTFDCPLCGGKAEGIKSSYNGHLHAQCKKCDMHIAQ